MSILKLILFLFSSKPDCLSPRPRVGWENFAKQDWLSNSQVPVKNDNGRLLVQKVLILFHDDSQAFDQAQALLGNCSGHTPVKPDGVEVLCRVERRRAQQRKETPVPCSST